ncbi:MAG TPA: DUF4142 domain-containing protein [Azospirillaceae bacterium]|nr:DUF4142 domain-containing protein [Azospirillaceae bacterium]
MIRRSAILAGALALPLFLSGAALAQSTDSSTTSGSTSSTASTMSGKTDAKSMKAMAAANSMVSLESSQLALQKASNPMVKQFAQLEAEEQKNMMAAMKAMGDDAMPKSIPDDKKQAMSKMQSASGAEFDRMYVTAQIQAHQELLQMQQAMLEKDDDSREAVMPLLAVPAIKTHIAMLQMIQQDIGAGTASSR